MSIIQLQYPRITRADLADLRVIRNSGQVRVTWPPVGLSFSHREDEEDYDDTVPLLIPNDAIRCTNSEFSFLDDIGVIFPHYAEVAVLDTNAIPGVARYSSIRLGGVEATIGDPTPLMQYLFGYAVFGNDYLTGWDSIHTIRLRGNIRDVAERKLLQALLAFGAAFRSTLVITPLDTSSYEYFGENEQHQEHEGDAETNTSTCKTAANDQAIQAPEFRIFEIDALRLFYSAMLAGDPEYSFLQYYRVIEYYSVLQHVDELAKIRWNRAVSSTEFVSKAITLVSKEDRKHVCALVARVASPSVLKAAVEREIIRTEDGGALGNVLYDFRNSVVHAKYDPRFPMHIPDLFYKNTAIVQWRDIAKILARDTMKKFGTPDQ